MGLKDPPDEEYGQKVDENFVSRMEHTERIMQTIASAMVLLLWSFQKKSGIGEKMTLATVCAANSKWTQHAQGN